MLAPVVVSLSATDCVVVYVPPTGEKVGGAVCAVVPEAEYVQEMTSAMTANPPEPPVKHITIARAERGGNIDGPTCGEAGGGDGVGDGHGERGAVVDHVDVECIGGMEIDGGRQRDGGGGGRSAVQIEAGGIDAFAVVAVEVEFDTDALEDTGWIGFGRIVGAVTEAAADGTESGGAGVLNDEHEAVAGGRGAAGELEAEIVGEGGSVGEGTEPRGAVFVEIAVHDAEARAANSGLAVEDHAASGETAAEIDGAGTVEVDGVGAGRDVAGEEAGSGGDGFDGGGGADGNG